MAKRILVVPDVHGRTFWKEPVRKYIDEVNRVVFLGDYLDPYDEEGTDRRPEALFDNLMEIVALKQEQPDKVVLLKGNHDQHYASERFRKEAGGSRLDEENWEKYHEFFCKHKPLFRLAHTEMVKGIPYIFTHAGVTAFWLNEVNSQVWMLPDGEVSLADPQTVEAINLLDFDGPGQDLLAIVGWRRSWLGEKTGSVLWADIFEHSTPHAPNAYGLDKVFQVFGHTRLDGHIDDKIEYENLVMVDSQKCFIVDSAFDEKIMTARDYEMKVAKGQ